MATTATDKDAKDKPAPPPETKTVTGEVYVHQDYPKMLYKAAPPDDDKKDEKPPLTKVVASKEEEDEAAKDGWGEDVPTPKDAKPKGGAQPAPATAAPHEAEHKRFSK